MFRLLVGSFDHRLSSRAKVSLYLDCISKLNLFLFFFFTLWWSILLNCVRVIFVAPRPFAVRLFSWLLFKLTLSLIIWDESGRVVFWLDSVIALLSCFFIRISRDPQFADELVSFLYLREVGELKNLLALLLHFLLLLLFHLAEQSFLPWGSDHVGCVKWLECMYLDGSPQRWLCLVHLSYAFQRDNNLSFVAMYRSEEAYIVLT